MKANKLTTTPITEPESPEPTTPAADEVLTPEELTDAEESAEEFRHDRFTWHDEDITWLN